MKAKNNTGISIHVKGNIGEVGKYGVERLTYIAGQIEGLDDSVSITVGTYSGSNEIKGMVETGKFELDKISEAFLFRKISEHEYILIGYDDKGLMYGCLHITEKLKRNPDMSVIMDTSEQPYTKVRGLYTFLHNKDLEKEWFYSKEYWEGYFDMMAENRFNSFNLVFSHQTFYLAPMFAYFVKVEDHPEIYPIDADEEQINKNYSMLQFITKEAEKRGIDFILGIWQVRSWKGSEGDWRPKQEGTVKGLTNDNIMDYTYKALKKLLKELEGIKGVQIRANEESGIPKYMQTEFFTNTFFKVIRESERPILFDFRGWMAEKQTVENAIELCSNIRLSVKYWAEFMGAPYQPGKIRPGYSYSDFLKQPLPYDFMWQVWSLGSPRLLLWGDPAYVKRFVHSLKLGGGIGFEINPHLAQKGYGDEPGYWRIFKNRKDEYYTWEYERYWMFFKLFGRLSYNPDLSEEEWQNSIEDRFGPECVQNVLDSYTYGSRIITYLIQFMLNDPNMYVWPEIDTGGMLDLYLETPTSDECTINTIPQFIREYLSDDLSGKLSPDKASDYFRELAVKVLVSTNVLEKCNLKLKNKELASTIIDFKVLSYLALYHSKKIHAAKQLQFFYAIRDYSALKKCYSFIREATVYWEQIISITQDIYYDRMVTGPMDTGHWKKKLTMVYEDEIRIAEMLKLFEAYGNFYRGFDFGAENGNENRDFNRFPVLKNYTVERGFMEVSETCNYTRERGYGFEDREVIKAVKAPLVRLSDKHTDNKRRDAQIDTGADRLKGYRNMLYEDYLYGEKAAVFHIDVEEGEYEIILSMADQSPNAKCHGPMSITIGETVFKDITVMPVEIVERKARVKAIGGRISIAFDCESGNDWIISGIVVKQLKPVIACVPNRIMSDNTIISSTVTCPDPIEKVELFITSPDEGIDVLAMSSRDGFTYSVDTAGCVEYGKNYTYFIKAFAVNGMESSTEEINLFRKGSDSSFEVNHVPVKKCREGEDIGIKLSIKSQYELKRIRLYYSYVNQFKGMEWVEMVKKDGEYIGYIPASYIDQDWDILYYFDLVDACGEGMIYPDFKMETPYYIIEVER